MRILRRCLQEIFAEQYSFEFVEEVETRTRTETRTDPSTGETYEVEVTYEWRILNVNLTAKSFTDVIAARMDTEQAQLFNILMMTKGNRQYVSNVFGDTNWLPYVTSYYATASTPSSGEKNYHKAVDIGMPQARRFWPGMTAW